jgi:hypothetical protein
VGRTGTRGAPIPLKCSLPFTRYARRVAQKLGQAARATAVGALAITFSLGLASCSNGQDPVATTERSPDAIASAVQLHSSDMPQGWIAHSVDLTSPPGIPDSDESDRALAGCMGIPNPWSARPRAEARSKVFHDPTGVTSVSVVTQVEESSANAESRMTAIANKTYPECMSQGDEKLFRDLFKPLFKKYPEAELGPVKVQVAANPASSGVHSSTVSIALEIGADGNELAVFNFQSIILQKGPVISRLGVALEYEGTESPPLSTGGLLEELDNLVTTRLSEQVPMPNNDGFRDGEVLVVERSPGIPYGYALKNVSCTVNSSDTMVDATGTFAGTKGRPLPALPIGTTYDVSVGVADYQPDSNGFSATNEQTAYMNHGGKWSVEVRVSPDDTQVSCMYFVGANAVTPPLIPIALPLPKPRVLT